MAAISTEVSSITVAFTVSMVLKTPIEGRCAVRLTGKRIVRPRVAGIRIIANARRLQMLGHAADPHSRVLEVVISAHENCRAVAPVAGIGRTATTTTSHGRDCLSEESDEIVCLRVDAARGTTRGPLATTSNCHALLRIRDLNSGTKAT